MWRYPGSSEDNFISLSNIGINDLKGYNTFSYTIIIFGTNPQFAPNELKSSYGPFTLALDDLCSKMATLSLFVSKSLCGLHYKNGLVEALRGGIACCCPATF